jgi:hypothetical protein
MEHTKISSSTAINVHSLLSAEQHESVIIKGCNNIVKRVDPSNSKKCINSLCELLGSLPHDNLNSNDLFLSQSHVKGLVTVSDFDVTRSAAEKIKAYICCDFNCHATNRNWYRSPWTNLYCEKTSNKNDHLIPRSSEFEAEATTTTTSSWLRKMEILANELWETYTRLYYGVTSSSDDDDDGNGTKIDVAVVPSVYLWEHQQNDSSNKFNNNSSIVFEGCYAIYKQVITVDDDASNKKKEIAWISLHQVQVTKDNTENSIVYLVNSTFDVTMKTTNTIHSFRQSNNTIHNNDNNNAIMNNTLKGQYHRQKIEKLQQKQQQQQDYLKHLGQMIEQIEIDLRSNMNSLSIQLTKDVVDSLSGNKDTFQQDQQQKYAIMLSEAIFLRKK